MLVQYQQSPAGSTQTGVPPCREITGLTTWEAEDNRRISATLGMKSLWPSLWLRWANTANGQMSATVSTVASIMLMVLARPLNNVSLVLAPHDTKVSQYLPSNLVARFKGTRVAQGLIISLVGLVVLSLIIAKNHFVNAALDVADLEVPMKQVGQAMVGSGKYGYVLPFEFISLFLLACIVGGVMIARKEDDK